MRSGILFNDRKLDFRIHVSFVRFLLLFDFLSFKLIFISLRSVAALHSSMLQ